MTDPRNKPQKRRLRTLPILLFAGELAVVILMATVATMDFSSNRQKEASIYGKEGHGSLQTGAHPGR